MKDEIILFLITTMVNRLDTELVRRGMDALLDEIEDYVASTPNQYDDALIGGLCSTIRAALNIPDTDE